MTENRNAFRVLVVEDQFLVALEVEAVLATLGWRTIGPAATVRRALDLIGREAPDGAVLDINLNGTLVYPVAEELRRRGVPFAFLTGYSGHLAVPETLRDVPRLQKPFEAATLARRLTAILKGSSQGAAP